MRKILKALNLFYNFFLRYIDNKIFVSSSDNYFEIYKISEKQNIARNETK